MAQKGGKRRQAPTYSADTMALRYIAGLALIALGVLVFMAVDLGMGNQHDPVFGSFQYASFGLCGSLAYVLAALPLWAGGLVIWSAQRRAPVRPWIFALLSFIGICTFIMLISGSGMESLKTRIDQTGGNWFTAISLSFDDCARTGMGGGAVGAVLGWPVWRYLSGVVGSVLFFLLTLFCLLMMVNLTPSRIRDMITGQAQNRRQQQQNERMQAEEQQLAWQQQQAMQQQAWQQQQARMIEQQQAYRAQENLNKAAAWPQPPRSQQSANSVQNWQNEMTARQTAALATQNGQQSRIFGKKNPPKEKAERTSWASRIFGKKEEYDGLTDKGPGTDELRAAAQARTEQPVRRTATGSPITPPATHWNAGTEQPVQEEIQAPVRPARRKEEPEKKDAGEAPAKPAPRNMDAYRRPAEQPAEAPEEKPVRAEKAERPGRSERAEKRPVVPAVQQTIGQEAFTPVLKLKPSEKTHEAEDDDWMPTPYNFPPITDLAMPKATQEDTAAEDAMRSRKLEETLASFKVQARVVNVTHGPAISRFEMELAAGTKVNKVAELEKDIAYGMEATSIRIEAPIPGKSLVGVEVPNRKVATVTLREVLQSEKMQNAKSLLTVALGKDIAGTPIVCDLAKMPHMLIAGQTGSGKSVCINAIINSLLYRASPDEVKLILVDPKVVELQCYNNIPHLLIPVVNDPHKAAAALAWAVAEMMERYDKFAERKVRNLDGYNAVIGKREKPMSRIVIIIDELADLMMVCKKDVEEYICRLTQLARAAGIHLIVATQRPSVDVITGLIKANIPSRIAFKTASSVDSRTILDRNGSEQLLGWGDMLYLPTGSFAPTRVQGCFLSDEEVNRIVKHVRDANPSTYDPNILEKLEEISNGGATEGTGADLVGGAGDFGGGDGNLFEQAVEYAIADGQISTSTLQRRLKIGYARAGRLTDEMEERGIVAAKDGSKPRKCLITREEWEEMKQSTEGMR